LDYLGILLNVVTCAITFIYAGLYEKPGLRAFYISLTALCAIAVFFVVMNPLADGPQAAILR
jgi:predicted membrane channel-forming protein YqfA (hemolysin III family)